MTNRRVIIALKGLGALANHGVYDFERDRNQRFSADIVMWVETAGTADDIAATVSYADIADEAMAVLTGTAVDLIETLAETIASRVMSHEGVVGTEVTVHKPDAPIDHPFTDVSVTVRAGQTDAMPLSLSLKGIYEAEDGSVLTGEIEAYGHAQAPSPAEQEQSGALPTRRDVQAAHAAPAHDATRPEHLRSRRVVLAIGGNLGDVPVTLMHTVEALSYMEGFQIDDVSPIMRTKPVLAPGQAPQPDYWNAVVVGSAIATPDELFAQTSRIERELGRERHERWGARTVDIDIIQIEGLASSDPVLTLPHPRAKERAFVLAPWLLCEPDAVLEGVGRVSDLLADTPDREGIIDAVDDWLEDPAAVMADSDQLLAQRAEQASADMRELIEALTGEISQVSDLVTRPGEPAEPVEIPAAHTVIEDSGDDVEEAADSESAHEQAEEPEAAPVSADEAPAPRASIWGRLSAAQASHEAVSTDEHEASEPELDEPASHDVDVPEAEAPVAHAAAQTDEPDAAPQAAAPQGEAPTDEAPTAPAVPGPPHRQRRRRTDEAKASSRPSWHPVSSVPADSAAGRMTRKIGTGTYKPSGTEKPRWAPVFESKREESRSKIALPDWNFSVGASHDVRVVDDRSGLGRDDEAPKATVHADGRSTILAPGLPDNTPVGPIPEDEATQTGILRRVVVRPTMTGAIPIVKRR
ncbi:2-amino-4-hydroxy-6-hydroxymethyldihydropteridine diphosphokinase [Xylanimonas cellulosilytica]|uniref:2-amino-4-hydroxy-6- hydroxymethyldihydropteridine diphosphokinase n=1 Tax=Xylanimonas cellulosilytica TaxID=186189 RepID=UPI00065F89D2|nr:2-amino-4-hydroxy-6-hydroxymethyldihydropteridine diphosphokinase [Xylanimonas cellulosilytica]